MCLVSDKKKKSRGIQIVFEGPFEYLEQFCIRHNIKESLMDGLNSEWAEPLYRINHLLFSGIS